MSKVSIFNTQNTLFEQYSELCDQIRKILDRSQQIISTNLLEVFIRLYGHSERAAYIFQFISERVPDQSVIDIESFSSIIKGAQDECCRDLYDEDMSEFLINPGFNDTPEVMLENFYPGTNFDQFKTQQADFCDKKLSKNQIKTINLISEMIDQNIARYFSGTGITTDKFDVDLLHLIISHMAYNLDIITWDFVEYIEKLFKGQARLVVFKILAQQSYQESDNDVKV